MAWIGCAVPPAQVDHIVGDIGHVEVRKAKGLIAGVAVGAGCRSRHRFEPTGYDPRMRHTYTEILSELIERIAVLRYRPSAVRAASNFSTD